MLSEETNNLFSFYENKAVTICVCLQNVSQNKIRQNDYYPDKFQTGYNKLTLNYRVGFLIVACCSALLKRFCELV